MNKEKDLDSYIRCPRCELNFIKKKDKYCSVCKREMEAAFKKSDELDMDLGTDFDICPICHTNYIREDEEMCATCQRERDLDRSLHGDEEEVLEKLDDEEDEEGEPKEEDEFGVMVGITEEEDAIDDLGELDLDISMDDEDLDFDEMADFDEEEATEEDGFEEDFEDENEEEDDDEE